MDESEKRFFLEDLSWKIYEIFFLDMPYKKKMLIAFLIISMGPLLTYMAAVYFVGFTLRTLPFFILINLVVVYLASLTFTNNLLRPLLQLAREARKIDINTFKGELDVKVGKDEIRDLVESINKMGRAMSTAFETSNSVITGLGEAMYVCDRDLVVTHINPAACELLGYTSIEILGKRCFEFTKYGGGGDPACHTAMCSSDQVLKGKKNIIRREVILISKSGEEIPVRINTSPLRDRNGTVRGVIKLVTDLRDIKAKEKEVEDAKKYLETQVERLLPVVQAAAEGDLTRAIQAERDDAFGKLVNAFNKMIEDLKELVNNVISTASTVASTSEELAASSEEMTATTEELASTIEQIAHGAQMQVREMEKASREMDNISDMLQMVNSTNQSLS
ncbi:MAG: PAS domain-containing protein, partial [Euryarchaeota archaeon]|nr:PAS domain-containing protein [Euryarchaeota archaeon]